MKIKVRNSPKLIHSCCKKFFYSLFPFCWAYCRYHITCSQSSLTGCSNLLSLLGSLWKSQAALYLLQQHLLFWDYIHSFRQCGCFWNRQKMVDDIWMQDGSLLSSLSLHTHSKNWGGIWPLHQSYTFCQRCTESLHYVWHWFQSIDFSVIMFHLKVLTVPFTCVCQ